MADKSTIMYVVRHGETDWNAQGRMQGWQNSNLTDNGVKQALAVATAMENRQISHIFSSDLGRAQQTAIIIGGKLGLPIELEQGLRERNLGIAQGLTVPEFKDKYPDEYDKFFSGDKDYQIPDGESIIQRHQRSWQSAQNICARFPGETILLIVHGGTLTSMFNHAMNFDPAHPRNFSLFNSSINRFTIDNDSWTLDTWGEISHLNDLDNPITLAKYV